MPVTNRFNFGMDDDSDNQVESDQEEISKNVDPYVMLKEIGDKALKKAKQDRKAAKQVKIEEPVVEKEEKKPRQRKEPVANNGPRKGRRNQDSVDDKRERNDRPYRNRNDKGDENNNNQKDKRYKRPRDQDRKSGNPRTGVKSNEKRNGGGSANWGDPTDPKVYDDIETEKQTPTSDANDENNDPEKSDAENKEPEAEPEIQLTLEEYEAQNSGQVISSNKTVTRKPNNGEELKGTIIVKGKADKIYVDDFALHRINKPQEKSKQVLQANLISGGRGGFRHDALGNFNNRNNRGGRGGGNRGRGGRGGRQNFNRPNQEDANEDGKSKEFSLVSEDYPTLGKAK